MFIKKLRQIIQASSFVVLTYGGHIGVNLGYALPCFSCPYVYSCGGYCFIMFLQRVGFFGIAAYDRLYTYIGLQNILWFFVFILLASLLSRFWCGWICPFGTFLDVLARLRHKMGIRELELSEKAIQRLGYLQWTFLGIIFLVPLLISFANFSQDLRILFCKICPARVVMPMFVGDFGRIGLEYSNWLTLIISLIGTGFAAFTIIASFYKDRFFCLVCPMLPLIKICDRFSPWSFTKKAVRCHGCGNCQRVCPMDIREVHLKKVDGSVKDDRCILCMNCMEACPENESLKLSFMGREIFKSSKKYFINRFLKSR